MRTPGIERLLVANRGEIAVRVFRAAQALGVGTVAVAPEDDAGALHLRRADTARALPGRGAAAYLDVAAIVDVARLTGCDAVHPGYGFLSERAELARACDAAGLTFVGPGPDALDRLGDKAAARDLARACGVPVVPGTAGPVTEGEAAAFLASLGPGAAVMIKAVAGGGGRGMRAVTGPAELSEAYGRCRSEAAAAFGDGAVYVEQLVRHARHVEVQVLGDGQGGVLALGDRECSLQRRHQKLVEFAPALDLPPGTRAALAEAAVAMADRLAYRSLGTFEFLVDAEVPTWFAFIEANARLQVEHTVTEEVTGLDLVGLQLRVAGGATLGFLGLDPARPPVARGRAMQLRVNTETMAEDGSVRPTGGVLALFEPPSGPGIRVDTAASAGAAVHPGFDSLLAKVICSTPGGDLPGEGPEELARLYRLGRRALSELRTDGVATNAAFLAALLDHPGLRGAPPSTRFVEDHAAELVEAARAVAEAALDRGLDRGPDRGPDRGREAGGGPGAATPDATVPAAVTVPPGSVAVPAPMQGTVVSFAVAPGDRVRAGAEVAVLEAMKMEHVITAPGSAGTVSQLAVAVGSTRYEGEPLLVIEEGEVEAGAEAAAVALDLDHIRPDLAEVLDRHAVGEDARRPEAVARRRRTGHRTARENLADLVDAGSWMEYGQLALADQRSRFDLDWLVANSPADGMLAGIGTVNAGLFGDEETQTVVMAYDYTVFAGTQGVTNHHKKDRLFDIAERSKLPVVFFAEGGGGRPGADWEASPGFDLGTFHAWGRLSGLVPLVGITTGRCFAGNAAILGCCDVIIATEGSNIGMGGPAMIEGGGLGVFRAEEVGPMGVQVPNGVVDVAVADEAEAVEVAKRYLGYFQGPVPTWSQHDQRQLRHVVPENRLRVYDVRRVIELVADVGTVLELRPEFGRAMVTALVRVEGRPLGLIANNAAHIGGAIDADAADKASRFMQVCDAFGLPVLMLCDTPGIMVGPEVEKTALVRHASRMFVTASNLSVPVFTLVLRKSYGLGLGMAAGSFRTPMWAVSWPTGEFGGMGLEGFVRLGFRKEMEALEDPAEQQAFFDLKLAELYEVGKALNVATHFELDDVIDPAETRRWVVRGLQATARYSWAPTQKRRPFIDTW